MATNDTLNSAGKASTPVRLGEGETATYTLTPTSYTGPILLEKGDSLSSMSLFQQLPSNAAGILYGPAIYRFRMAQNYVSGSVASSINDPTISSLKVTGALAMTQSAYNALNAPDPRTLYLIVG